MRLLALILAALAFVAGVLGLVSHYWLFANPARYMPSLATTPTARVVWCTLAVLTASGALRALARAPRRPTRIFGIVALSTVMVATPAFAAFSVSSKPAATMTFSASTMTAASGLSGSATGQTVNLSWTAVTTGTKVYRASSSGAQDVNSPITTIAGTATTTYADTPGAGTWYYVVRSYNQNWYSTASNEISVTVVAAPTLVTANTTCGTASASPITTTYTNTPTQGDLLVAVFAARVSGTMSMTSAGWTQARRDDASGPDMSIWYKTAGASETKTVTVATTASGSGNALDLLEFNNVASNTADKTAGGTGTNSTTATSGTTAATTAANEAIVVGFVHKSGTAYSNLTAGYSVATGNGRNHVVGSGGSATLVGVATQIVSSTGAQSASATSTAADNSRGMIATFK